MTDLLQRLLNIARAHLYDVLDLPGSTASSWWDTESTTSDAGDTGDTGRQSSGNGRYRRSGPASGATSYTASGLPHSPELARAYALLDLPFGAPEKEVSERWKTYLKQCHPDRFATDPAKHADATELSQALTEAHHAIQAAWKQYARTQ